MLYIVDERRETFFFDINIIYTFYMICYGRFNCYVQIFTAEDTRKIIKTEEIQEGNGREYSIKKNNNKNWNRHELSKCNYNEGVQGRETNTSRGTHPFAELCRHARSRRCTVARTDDWPPHDASISFNDALKAPTDRYNNGHIGRGTFAAGAHKLCQSLHRYFVVLNVPARATNDNLSTISAFQSAASGPHKLRIFLHTSSCIQMSEYSDNTLRMTLTRSYLCSCSEVHIRAHTLTQAQAQAQIQIISLWDHPFTLRVKLGLKLTLGFAFSLSLFLSLSLSLSHSLHFFLFLPLLPFFLRFSFTPPFSQVYGRTLILWFSRALSSLRQTQFITRPYLHRVLLLLRLD